MRIRDLARDGDIYVLDSVWTAGARALGGTAVFSTLVLHSRALALVGWVLIAAGWIAAAIDARRHPELVEELSRDDRAG